MNVKGDNLFYEWNNTGGPGYVDTIEINDETLRDGIQSTAIRYPSLEEKLRLVKQMAELGIDMADIGFPAAGAAMVRDLEGIIRYIQDNKLALKIACAARTVEEDITPIARLSQKFGIPIDANIFVGSSPIRQFVEGWDINHILKLVKNSLAAAVKYNLPVCFITEDTTRSNPDDLAKIYQTAAAAGAYRVCLCDTVGYALPEGTKKLVTFIRSILGEDGKDISIDWHGHNDRGLGLVNALAALEAGVNRVHATCLGIGERAGNTSMEQLIINLKMLGLKDINIIKLKHYCMTGAEILGVKIPANLPVVGGSVFSTAAGIHAAAIIKSKKMNNDWLADRVYSSIPAGELGFEQKIEIGPLSGKANVTYLLEKNNIQDDDLANEIFSEIKIKGHQLTREELAGIFEKYGHRLI